VKDCQFIIIFRFRQIYEKKQDPPNKFVGLVKGIYENTHFVSDCINKYDDL
jgi:hypothetical protein